MLVVLREPLRGFTSALSQAAGASAEEEILTATPPITAAGAS
ncbi:cation efflux transporter [Synechococcus sp. A18-25c]|nr:cation efflux transporter [Synechococcus sp. A15-60]QNJ20129.1 cation efflux transporter [Synechococcus sp. A18-25c]